MGGGFLAAFWLFPVNIHTMVANLEGQMGKASFPGVAFVGLAGMTRYAGCCMMDFLRLICFFCIYLRACADRTAMTASMQNEETIFGACLLNNVYLSLPAIPGIHKTPRHLYGPSRDTRRNQPFSHLGQSPRHILADHPLAPPQDLPSSCDARPEIAV